jgi:nicotinamidase-related amidase
MEPEGRMALLVMDGQVGIVARFGGGELLLRLNEAVRAARTASIPIIFVRVAFRRDSQK